MTDIMGKEIYIKDNLAISLVNTSNILFIVRVVSIFEQWMA